MDSRRTWLKVCASVSADETHNPGQNHGADDRDHNADDQTVLANSAESEVAGQKAANERADQAENHVHEKTEALSFHQLPGNPACEQSDDDPRNKPMSHVIVLLL